MVRYARDNNKNREDSFMRSFERFLGSIFDILVFIAIFVLVIISLLA